MLKSKKVINILLAAVLMLLPLILSISSNVSAEEPVTVSKDIAGYPIETSAPDYYNYYYRDYTSTFYYPVHVDGYNGNGGNTLAEGHSDFWNAVKNAIHTAQPGEAVTIDAGNYASGGKKTLNAETDSAVINVYPIIYNNIPYGVFEWLYYAKGKTLYVHYTNITLKYTPKDVKTPEIPGIIRYLDVYGGVYTNKYLSVNLIRK
ncbi:MAG: hypothetical protein LBC56_06750 [Oscillospiraceae bacterium]|jgi:hypothetical protein|nr:hypothetical protein [Oscillospiraceae bacterium]